MPKIKLALFDTFNTVYNMGACKRSEIEGYARHLKDFRETGVWKPLRFPKNWYTLIGHSDHPAIHAIRNDGVICATLSNGPVDLQVSLARHNGINWDFIVPLEAYQTFKPMSRAYMAAKNCFPEISYDECLMITANKEFGDIEAARALGMEAIWVDRKHEQENYPINDLWCVRRYINVGEP